MTRSGIAAVLACSLVWSLAAQAPPTALDPATIGRIRAEALQRSQAVETHWWLSEVYGPRPTGTPAYDQAAAWAIKRLTEWGLANVHLERFPFGQGWTLERFSAHLVSPQVQVLIGHPRWNSPSTSGPVTADVVHVRAASEADLAKYQGQLRGKIVVMQAARAVRLLDGRIVLRMTERDWDEAMRTPIPSGGPAPGAAELYVGEVREVAAVHRAALEVGRARPVVAQVEPPVVGDVVVAAPGIDARVVERGRHGKHDRLFFQAVRGPCARPYMVPAFGQVLQVPCRGFHWRQTIHVGRGAPRQERRGPVHAAVAEPALGRRDQPPGNAGAVVAGLGRAAMLLLPAADALAKPFQDAPGVVRRTVVDDDNLMIHAGLIECGRDRLLDVPSRIIGRDDHADRGHRTS